MNRYYVFAAIFFLVAGAAVGQQVNDANSKEKLAAVRDKDLREIERSEIEWNRINEVSDPEGKRLILAEDSYHVGPSGRIYTKAQDIEAARVSEEKNKSSGSTLKIIITNKRIRLYTDVAVVTATGTSIRTAEDGKTRNGNPFRVVHVWEKRDGSWLLVVDQVTGIVN